MQRPSYPFPSVHPSLVLDGLRGSGDGFQRVDGRGSKFGCRSLQLDVLDLGSVVVSLGGGQDAAGAVGGTTTSAADEQASCSSSPATRVYSLCTGEIVKPSPDRPNLGRINFVVDLDPSLEVDSIERKEFNTNASRNQTVCVSQRIERVLRGAGAVDEESLCIVHGEKCWELTVHVRVIFNDGNLADCCVIAALMALKTFRKEHVRILDAGAEGANAEDVEAEAAEEGAGGDDTHEIDKAADLTSSTSKRRVEVVDREEREPAPLNVHHLPIPVTFGFISASGKQSFAGPSAGSEAGGDKSKEANRGRIGLADLNRSEEQLADGSATVAVNQYGEICLLEVLGAHLEQEELFSDYIPFATRRSKEIVSYLSKRVQDFEEDRRLKRTKRLRKGC
eukprot:g4496.t1